MIDLNSIFSEFAVSPEPAPRMLFPEPVDDVVDDPFAGWVRRPDHRWRLGWEAPDLPEWQRWWARGDFEDFPEVPPDFEFGGPINPPGSAATGKNATAHCPLPTAHCPLPTAHCPLTTAH